MEKKERNLVRPRSYREMGVCGGTKEISVCDGVWCLFSQDLLLSVFCVCVFYVCLPLHYFR